jgi:exodeoxyribonuclease V alpha subunit
MNHHDSDRSAVLLAEGFADHVTAWTLETVGTNNVTAYKQIRDVVHRAAFLTSLATSGGHVCALLKDLAGAMEIEDDGLRQALMQSGVVGTPQEPGAMPLILDAAGRLYLHRYFDYEQRLARRFLGMGRPPLPVENKVRERLQELFAGSAARTSGPPDWQMIAAALALRNQVTVISGGPGTGKTSTVVNILACLLEHAPQCKIALAAPTGKAASRMLEAIRSRAEDLPGAIQDVLPTESYTIHRLLGVTPTPGVFRHHAANPLAIDVLILDEASMLDLALAVKLFEAVPPASRIILLGDKDQLAAVESGAVFSELCADATLTDDCIAELAAITGTAAERIVPPKTEFPGFRDSVVWFSENYRFRKESCIGKLAAGIGAGEPEAVIEWLRGKPGEEASWTEDRNEDISEATLAAILDGYASYIGEVSAAVPATNPGKIFEAFGQFRVLCAVRNTYRGVESLNRLIADRLRPLLGKAPQGATWYTGRPIMVTRNDYSLRLFNGDIGIALPDTTGELMVWFPDQEQTFRAIAPGRLSAHETAFAMTVHKSQGSEFDKVLLVLPDRPNRIVTRELLYTGITRVRKQVSIVGPEQVLEHAIIHRTKRQSGLLDRIKELGTADTPEARAA